MVRLWGRSAARHAWTAAAVIALTAMGWTFLDGALAQAQTKPAATDAKKKPDGKNAAAPTGDKNDPNAPKLPANPNQGDPAATTPEGVEAPVTSLDSVTTTATRSRRSIFETPAHVDVINRYDMDRRMQTTIEDMIRYVPGVFVNRQSTGTDPFNSLGGFTIRGVGGNRVQTLVDGSRIIERITDQTRDFVDLSNMKLVEVVRGPGSVLWGSDALGGIVAFATKDPSDYLDPGQTYAVQASGIFDSVNTSFIETVTGAARLGSNLELLVSYTRRDAGEVHLGKAKSPDGKWPCTRAPESNPCNKFDPTNIGSNNFLGKLIYKISPKNQIKLTGEFFNRITDVEQLWDHGRGVNSDGSFSTTETLEYLRKQDLKRFRVALAQDWETGSNWLYSVNWQLVYHPQKLDRTGNRLQNVGGELIHRDDFLGYKEVFYEADVQLKSVFETSWMRHEFTYGFDGGLTTTDYERRDVTTNLTTGETTTAIAGGFNFANSKTWRADFYIQDEISFFNRRIILIPGLRYSTYRITPELGPGYEIVPGKEPREIYESNLSYKFGAIFKLTKAFSVYVRYAEGFKMPTAEQLYTSLPGTFFNLVPNPNLRPEKVQSYEIGLRGKFKRAFFSVNFFYARYKDFIQSFVFIDGTNDITFDNVSRVKIWGIEGKAAWRFLPEWEISGAFSWQRGEQQTTPDSPVRVYDGAAPFKLVAGIRWTRPRWGLDVELVGTYQAAVTRVNEVDNDPFKAGSYFVMDFTVQWKPRKWLTLHFSVLNILDTRYFLPSSVNYDRVPPSASVAATNPLELQTQPGRTFRFGLTMKF